MAAPDDKTKLNLLSSFTSVTGVTDADRTRFFLEAAGWNLDLAVESFFQEVDAEEEMPVDTPPLERHAQRSSTPPPAAREGAMHKHTKAASGPVSAPKSQSRIATLGSLAAAESCSSGDSDEEEGEAYYAGGSERGAGQQIIGPPKKKATSNLVNNMFKAAKERGAEVVDPSSSGAGASRGQTAFHGTAYRLGETSAPSEMVAGASASSGASVSREVHRVLHLWRNGFSIDDGPLRDYQSPENEQFLNDIKNGQVPRELIKESRGSEVSINMTDHRNEDYVKPKVVVQSFGGEGHRLGSPTDGTSIPAAAPPTSAAQAASSLADAANAVSVDLQRPTTSLQIRLTDGTRLVTKFNTTHRISDIRRYIIVARPEYATTNFTLMTTFPNKDLVDETLDLATAGLLNAVLVMKLNK